MMLLLLLSLAGLSQTGTRYLAIASWNIENLDGERKQDPDQLARHLALTGAQVIALQEIHHTGPGMSNPRLERALAQLDGDWDYRLFPNKPPNEKARLCGVAWNNKAVTPVGESFRIPIADDPNDDFPIWHRHPHATKFQSATSGKTDFILISIHQKSNGRPRGKDEFFTRRQRALEGRTLMEALPTVQKHFGDEKDVIIVGDTNCLDVAEPSLASYRGGGLRDLNLLDHNTHLKGSAPFDRFLVSQDQPEFAHSYQMVLSPTDRRSHEERVSDHYVILTQMELMDDDD